MVTLNTGPTEQTNMEIFYREVEYNSQLETLVWLDINGRISPNIL